MHTQAFASRGMHDVERFGLWATGVVLIGTQVFLERRMRKIEETSKEEMKLLKTISHSQLHFYDTVRKLLATEMHDKPQ